MIIERLEKQTGLTASQLEKYAETASKRYKVYSIQKRDGSERKIAQPSREIKAIQRWLIRTVFRMLLVHPCSTAYQKGASIRENARRHVASSYTLRLDFKEFFPSFSAIDILNFLSTKNIEGKFGLSKEDIWFATRIVTRHGALTIGAPSSPILTNAMMYDFDVRLCDWATSERLIYTRYADDLFLSSDVPGDLSSAPAVVGRFAREHKFGRLALNPEKTTFLSKRYRRSITGLVITPDHKLSIGRDKKRQLKTLIYLHSVGKLDDESTFYLRGMLAFVADVEPEFRWALMRKFGGETIGGLEGRPL